MPRLSNSDFGFGVVVVVLIEQNELWTSSSAAHTA
jgi:hypothetical protein